MSDWVVSFVAGRGVLLLIRTPYGRIPTYLGT